MKHYRFPSPTQVTALELPSHVKRVNQFLKDKEKALNIIKHNLQQAKDRIKAQADKHRSERVFKVGDLVYLKLKPYRQSIVAKMGNKKLAGKYYGPYEIKKKVGAVTYELILP